MGARGGTGVELELDNGSAARSGDVGLRDHAERIAGADVACRGEGQREGTPRGLPQVGTRCRHRRLCHRTMGLLRVRQHGKVNAEIPNTALGRRRSGLPAAASCRRQAPRFLRSICTPFSMAATTQRSQKFLERQDSAADELAEARGVARRISAAANGSGSSTTTWCSRTRWSGPGSDAAVIRVKGTKKALAMTLDGPGFRVAQNPREGAKLMVAEACRNIVCSGGRPLAATNCLNFGNPGTSRSDVAIQRSRRWNDRSLHRFRNADHGRQRQLLQRNIRAKTSIRRRCSALSE